MSFQFGFPCTQSSHEKVCILMNQSKFFVLGIKCFCARELTTELFSDETARLLKRLKVVNKPHDQNDGKKSDSMDSVN